ncbi:MAG TPA: DUF4389 domain-containing protein [Gaiellaceae bacterium]|nr:DUF4389 domain-containing protein [Gaiellaceae bacterium]
MDGHPVRLRIDDDLRRSRLLVFFRPLLALPHLAWLWAWSWLVLAAAPVGWVAVVATRTQPHPLHRFFCAYVRYASQLAAFAALLANPFPGFTGAPGYPVEVTTPERLTQSRWKSALRAILAVPALLLAHALLGVLVTIALLAWFAALATGRMPSGLRDLGATIVRYLAQTAAYALLVTDRYAHASPALPREPEPRLFDPWETAR